jgi:hypothetical protein
MVPVISVLVEVLEFVLSLQIDVITKQNSLTTTKQRYNITGNLSTTNKKYYLLSTFKIPNR